MKIVHISHFSFPVKETFLKLAIIATHCEPWILEEQKVLGFNRRIYVPSLNLQETKELLTA